MTTSKLSAVARFLSLGVALAVAGTALAARRGRQAPSPPGRLDALARRRPGDADAGQGEPGAGRGGPPGLQAPRCAAVDAPCERAPRRRGDPPRAQGLSRRSARQRWRRGEARGGRASRPDARSRRRGSVLRPQLRELEAPHRVVLDQRRPVHVRRGLPRVRSADRGRNLSLSGRRDLHRAGALRRHPQVRGRAPRPLRREQAERRQEQPRSVPPRRRPGQDDLRRRRLLRDRARAIPRPVPQRSPRHHPDPRLLPEERDRRGERPALPRPDHRRDHEPPRPGPFRERAGHRSRGRALHPDRHHHQGRWSRTERAGLVHAQSRDHPPPRRQHPVDQRRHPAPVDRPQGRGHAVQEGRHRRLRARHVVRREREPPPRAAAG